MGRALRAAHRATDRASIQWKKNCFSHFREAAWYTVMAAIRYHQPRVRDQSTGADPSDAIPGSSLSSIFGDGLLAD